MSLHGVTPRGWHAHARTVADHRTTAHPFTRTTTEEPTAMNATTARTAARATVARTARTITLHRAARLAATHATTVARLYVDHPPMLAAVDGDPADADARVPLSVVVAALGY